MGSIFDGLASQIQDGMDGKNQSIPIGLPKLGKYANLRKKILTLIFSTTGAGKCFTPGTKILMFNGSYKNVEDIIIGDEVMGTDSSKRIVIETHSGIDNMYRIDQNKGESYTVNSEHILRLRKRRKKIDEFLEIPVKEAIKKGTTFYHKWKGYKLGVHFIEKEIEIDPYFLGLWIGDGTSCKTQITSNDEEIIEYLKVFANENNLIVKKANGTKYGYDFSAKKLLKRTLKNGDIEFYNSVKEAAAKTNSIPKYISNVLRNLYNCYNNSNWQWIIKNNSLLEFLRKYNLECNKYIPQHFLINSRQNRLKLLAGLLDSDGHYQKYKNCYEITQKSKLITDQIAFLSRSLGFYSSINEKTAVLKRPGKEDYRCQVYRIFIFGEELAEIPCILPRKKAKNTPNKNINPTSTGIKITSIGTGKYHGFTIDGDGLFFLNDFTVAHNSSLIDTIILNACDSHANSPSVYKLRPDFQLFSMERNKAFRVAKWISYLIFKNEGEIIEIPKMLGWWDEKITKAQQSLILAQKSYIDTLLNDYITIHDGAKTPNEIYRIMKDHFEDKGKYDIVKIKGRDTKIYIPNNPNIVVSPIYDHGNLTKTTKELPTKKQAQDKLVEYTQGFRDLEEAAPIWIGQVNRAISGVTRLKDQEHELMLEDLKESGDISDACDIALSLFNPAMYNQSSKTGYVPTDFIDKNNGNNYFRSIQILKSSYGAESLRLPMGFNGFCGQFVELPKKKDLDDGQYNSLLESILNRSYFLKSN